jgi:hypothetical protein
LAKILLLDFLILLLFLCVLTNTSQWKFEFDIDFNTSDIDHLFPYFTFKITHSLAAEKKMKAKIIMKAALSRNQR